MDPVQFVSTGSSGSELILNESVMEQIKQERRPVTVISIIGPYRTGKSYLLNRLMGKANGFELGPTMEAKTKGIWIWKGDFPGHPKRCLVLLDVEGLSDTQKGDATHDLNLFVLALLASSVFIYNTKSTIDAAALDGLYLATKISEDLLANAEEEETFAQHFPIFLWAIRDHHLKLEIDGRAVSPNQYLDHCLKTKKGFSAKITNYNALRDAIRNYFPTRECMVFPPPTSDMEKMNYLDKISDSELAPEFKIAADKFVVFIMNHAPSKVIKGTEITGHAFTMLMQNYLESLLKKKISIQSTFSYVVNSENQRAIELAMDQLGKILSKEIPNLPVSTETVARVVEKAMTTATKVFLDSCISIEMNQKYLADLNEMIRKEIEVLERNNHEVSSQKCKAILNGLWEPLESKMDKSFVIPGGFAHLKHEVDNLKMTYLEISMNEELGPCKGIALKQFEDERLTPALERVLAADNQLSAMKKEEERLRLENEQREEETKRLEEETQKLREAQEQMERAHLKNMEQLQETITKQSQQEIESARKQMENEMAEMKRMQETDRKEMASRHQETIASLQREITAAQERSAREMERIQQENARVMAEIRSQNENREKFWEPLVNGAVKLSKIWISHLKAPKANTKP